MVSISLAQADSLIPNFAARMSSFDYVVLSNYADLRNAVIATDAFIGDVQEDSGQSDYLPLLTASGASETLRNQFSVFRFIAKARFNNLALATGLLSSDQQSDVYNEAVFAAETENFQSWDADELAQDVTSADKAFNTDFEAAVSQPSSLWEYLAPANQAESVAFRRCMLWTVSEGRLELGLVGT